MKHEDQVKSAAIVQTTPDDNQIKQKLNTNTVSHRQYPRIAYGLV